MKVTRNLLRQYYGIGETPTFHLCTPFTKMNEENSPVVDKSAFINDVNSSPTVIGYENGFTFEAQNVAGDEVVDDLVAIARKQLTGTDAERVLVDVDMSKEDSVTSGSYYARKFVVAVECTPPAGDPKSITKITGKLHQVGDMVEGLFAVATKTWSDTAYVPGT